MPLCRLQFSLVKGRPGPRVTVIDGPHPSASPLRRACAMHPGLAGTR